MVGLYTDRRPQPYSLPLDMACSLIGRVTLAFALNFPALLAGAALLGIGSSIFHPESSRLGIRNAAMRNAPKASGAATISGVPLSRTPSVDRSTITSGLIVNAFPVLTERRCEDKRIPLMYRSASKDQRSGPIDLHSPP
jgi:hypothetical protein